MSIASARHYGMLTKSNIIATFIMMLVPRYNGKITRMQQFGRRAYRYLAGAGAGSLKCQVGRQVAAELVGGQVDLDLTRLQEAQACLAAASAKVHV